MGGYIAADAAQEDALDTVQAAAAHDDEVRFRIGCGLQDDRTGRADFIQALQGDLR